MAFKRGDVVLVPFPYTDLRAAKTRPAIVVSSAVYHALRSDVLLAYVSSQVEKANPVLDYVLVDWSGAALLRPSYVRPKLAAVESSLIARVVGELSEQDMAEVDLRLGIALALPLLKSQTEKSTLSDKKPKID